MLAGAAHTFASRTRPGALCAALVAVAIGLSACGSGGSDDGVTIPKANSEQLLADLSAVQDASTAQDCRAARSAAESFVADVNALPIEVGTETKAALRDAGDNLVTLSQDCTPPAGTSDLLSSTAPAEPTTSSASTTTTTTSTTTSTESQTPPAQNPGEGNGPPGGGNPGGNGGGNGGSGGIGGGKTR